MINNNFNTSNLSHYFSIPSIPKFSSFFKNFADIKNVNFQSFTAKPLLKNHQNKIFIAVSLTLGVLIIAVYKIKRNLHQQKVNEQNKLHNLKVKEMINILAELNMRGREQIDNLCYSSESEIKNKGGIILFANPSPEISHYSGIFFKDNGIHFISGGESCIFNYEFFSKNMNLVADILAKNNLKPEFYSFDSRHNAKVTEDALKKWQKENKQATN